eukprot:CAMPEP_0177615132 /NCGR_PEP_ID=MMETSP0419_2-20121207/23220_1 /TAXON_ID=582737 /ORGANISM="Tetraselmis sp., Strain GSL018" /LENGTH=154 /DNA_ID=CAMNT_0019112625 /DNA_START=252 /DNA_END=712 /DNA_ORIENTATION=-
MSDSAAVLRFPSSRFALWDHTPTGTSTALSATEQAPLLHFHSEALGWILQQVESGVGGSASLRGKWDATGGGTPMLQLLPPSGGEGASCGGGHSVVPVLFPAADEPQGSESDWEQLQRRFASGFAFAAGADLDQAFPLLLRVSRSGGAGAASTV